MLSLWLSWSVPACAGMTRSWKNNSTKRTRPANREPRRFHLNQSLTDNQTAADPARTLPGTDPARGSAGRAVTG